MRAHEPKPVDGSTVSDEALMVEYRGGRIGAFEQLLQRYRQELFNFLARFLGDRVAAEDVFQETFIQVHVSAGTFDSERRFKPWLFTIAANKGRDYLRRRARRPAAEMDAPLSSGGSKDQSYLDLMSLDVPGPEENLAHEEVRQRVQAAVRMLPENLREALLLAYFQQMSYQEVAETLDIPLGTVKSRLHAAVGAFAKIWKTMNPGGRQSY